MVAWNHNTHHHGRVLALAPRIAGAALDVGCGDGMFAMRLAERFSEVVAIDRDAAQIALASARCANQSNVNVVKADFLACGLPAEHFDLVTALAAFHHVPFDEGAAEASRLLKPGGRLVVLGVWTDSGSPTDLAWNVASAALNQVLKRRRGPDAMTAPASLERTSLRSAQAEAAIHLPGARLRRRLLWRYTLVWDKPLS
jgi:ubiquinone/menaquinone biosynthesis C-methylase UbiE